MQPAKQHKVSIEYIADVDLYLAICKGLPGVDATGKTRGEAATLVDAKIIEYHKLIDETPAVTTAEPWP